MVNFEKMIKRQIPNLITSMNVLSGALAVFMGMYGQIGIAALLIILAMIFDFFDGMTARLLHVKSDIGKELDSLADMVSFGVAPAVLAHLLISKALPGYDFLHGAEWTWTERILVFSPLVIPPFSAYRLAKFNLDIRQTTSFIGLPTPAHALFWVGLVFAYQYAPEMYAMLFGNPWAFAICALILSVLLVCELPMFSLKIAGFGWKENKVRYFYFLTLILLICLLGKAMVVLIIPLYILFAVVEALLKNFTTTNR